jgi:hypothetical protein
MIVLLMVVRWVVARLPLNVCVKLILLLLMPTALRVLIIVIVDHRHHGLLMIMMTKWWRVHLEVPSEYQILRSLQGVMLVLINVLG